MSIVVGLDLSLAATGAARWWSGAGVACGTIKTRPLPDVNGWARPARHDAIIKELREFTHPYRGHPAPDGVCVIEKKINPGDGRDRGTTTLDLAELRGAVMRQLYYEELSIVEVYPATLKKFATGNGGADKKAMLAAARDLFGSALLVPDDNAADALWLVLMGCAAYGKWVVPRTRQRVEAVDRVEWPAFRIDEGVRT